MEKNEKYAGYSISQYARHGVRKNLWLRLGSGTAHPDGSFSLCLGVLPLPDPKTGFIQLYMRKTIAQDKGQNGVNKNVEANLNVELDPVFGIPLEAR